MSKKFETKIFEPLNFRLSHHGCTILGDAKHEDLPLAPGAMFGAEHYGFNLIIDNNGKQTEETYPTQFRIAAAEVKDDILSIYEDHKYECWQFDMQGKLIRPAQFLNISRRDVDYLADQGIFGEEAIQEVNDGAYKKSR